MPDQTATVTAQIHDAVVAGVRTDVSVRTLAREHGLTIGQVSATVRRARKAGELPPAGPPIVGRTLTPSDLAARASEDLRRRTERKIREALVRAAGRAEREATRPALAPKPVPARQPAFSWRRAAPTVRLDAWTVGDDDAVVRRTLAGDSAESIARDLGRTPGAIRGRVLLHRNRGRLPSRTDMSWSVEAESELLRLRAEGLSDADVAARLGRSEGAVWSRLCRLRRQGVAVHQSRRDHRWRRETVDAVADMAARGSTSEEISAAVGRSVTAVEAKIRDLRTEGRLPSPDDDSDEGHEPGRVRYPTPGADPLLAALFAAHGKH